MRYYRVEIGGDTPAVYTSWVNGVNDPGALTFECDIQLFRQASPGGNSWVRLWGVSQETRSQARDFNGAPIKVYVGMSKGLPLANPNQQGLVFEGQIQQGYGNWMGTQQSIDLICIPFIYDDPTTLSPTKNIVFTGKAGQAMGDVIKTTLEIAFPSRTVTVNVSGDVILQTDQPAYFSNMLQFAQFVRSLSQAIKGGTYTGIEITFRENSIVVYDGTEITTPKDISYLDLMGQPTWFAPAQIQVSTVMRGDLAVGEFIRLPQTSGIIQPGSFSQFRDKSIFQGVFRIDDIRHVGNSRNPEGTAWITTLQCASVE